MGFGIINNQGQQLKPEDNTRTIPANISIKLRPEQANLSCISSYIASSFDQSYVFISITSCIGPGAEARGLPGEYKVKEGLI
jgi:hypothetical protein